MSDSTIYMLMKIGKREHLESFQMGNLRFSPLKTYSNLEREKQEKGIGDINEGTLAITNVTVSLRRHDTNELVAEFPSEKILYEDQVYQNKPILCLSIIDEENLTLLDFWQTKLSITTLKLTIRLEQKSILMEIPK